jgi:hypothetical protein
MPSVFISYSHDSGDATHAERVAGLAASLSRDGLKVFLDAKRGESWRNNGFSSTEGNFMSCLSRRCFNYPELARLLPDKDPRNCYLIKSHRASFSL